jgi:hypothetical protein
MICRKPLFEFNSLEQTSRLAAVLWLKAKFLHFTDVLLLCDFQTAEMNSTEGLVELPETNLLYFENLSLLSQSCCFNLTTRRESPTPSKIADEFIVFGNSKLFAFIQILELFGGDTVQPCRIITNFWRKVLSLIFRVKIA